VILRAVEPEPPGGWRDRLRRTNASLPAPDPAKLYRQLAPAVLGYVRSQGAAEPEDLLGDIFLQIVRDIARFRGDDTALRRWVFTIAHHRLIDARRRAQRRPATSGGPAPDQAAGPRPEPLDPDLLEALAALTPEQREVVALRFVADLSIEAVAAVTGRSVGAVKALQHRALEALVRNLGEGWSPMSVAR